MPELDRRDFLKVVGLSAGAAAATACSDPVETIIPYLNQPEEIVPGIPTYYASTCRECPSACGIQVKTREGRPIKVDGNPEDPISKGALCMRGQASLARTYDASRLRGPLKREGDALVATSWEEAIDLLSKKLAAAGNKTFFLSGLETGTFGTLIDGFLGAVGAPGQRLSFELYSQDALRAANNALFGQRGVPHFAFEKADVLVAFGTDFLETWLNPTAAQAGFSQGRREGRGYAVYVGPRLSLSGANCDLWVDPEPGTEMWIALGLAKEVAKRRNAAEPLKKLLEPYGLDAVAAKTGVAAERLERIAGRIAKATAPLALPPGQEIQGANASAFAAAVQILNYVSGAVGNTVVFGPEHRFEGLGTFADLSGLAQKLGSKQIDVLFVHGTNPVYAAPQLGFADALKSTFTVSFASALDETASRADLVLPDHTPYETWGDTEPVVGVKRLQQPTIRPLFDTRATADVLLDVATKLGKTVPGTGGFRERLVAAHKDFNAALARGGELQPAAVRSVSLAAGAAALTFEDAALAGEGLTLLVYPSLNFYDGRSARIPLLQEIPDPVTKLVWGSYAELHPSTAKELGIELQDVITVKTAAGEVELPAVPHTAIRPGVIAIAAGQGHQPVELDAPEPDRHQRRKSIGVHALSLLPLSLDAKSGAQAWLGTRAQVTKTGRKALLPQTQATFNQEGRGVAQATTLAELQGSEVPAEEGVAQGDLNGEGHAEEHGHEGPYADAMHLETEEFDPALDATNPNYRWGMSIDLDACTGCGACMAACAVENNVPVIGETLVRQGREMHWIRIERYVEEHEDGAIEVRHTPMLCQHCGSAPCETVCPVFATYHNDEGLNVMVPNRCIGTRYCGNNCTYKVRRFNYFSYNWDVRDPEQWGLNPDVIVRSKGVMEKCTFCVQRINGAKDVARKDGGRVVRDGEITPACAQTCPSNAIVFGNFKDPESRLAKLQEDPRAYWVFHYLNTRPAVTYQKSILRSETEEA
jgi:molybdopterin-containing oxidoreductase family iron-sulfur binding subunit